MRPERANDQELIGRAKKGDTAAFEALVRKYQKLVYLLCHRITGAHQTADDLSQETFIKAFQALPHFVDGQDFYPWLRRIALNNCFNYLKIWKRGRPLVEEAGMNGHNFLSSPQESPSEALQRAEMEKKFRETLRKLPDDQKIIFTLRTFENMSYGEIARALALPAGTVMSRLNRARRKLKNGLAEYLRRR